MIIPGVMASNLSGDPNFSSVVMLLGLNGTDGQTTTTDDSNSAHAMTFNGQAQLDTAQKKFGTASALLDGSGDDFVSALDSADFDFGAGQFTIECRVRFNTVTLDDTFIAHWGGTGSSNASWHFRRDNTGKLLFGWSTTGADFIFTNATWTPVANQWYALAVDRDSADKIRVYVDGAMHNSKTDGATFFNSTARFTVGDLDVGGFGVDGWIDEVRITKGIARYASDSGYIVPTVAFPRS